MTSLPADTQIAAESSFRPARRRRLTRARLGRYAIPYLLILPVLAAIGAVLGYPVGYLINLSFQRYGLPELIQHTGEYIGLHNYYLVLHDSVFWNTLERTIVFTAANVGLTMGLGTALALLLVRVSTWVRIPLTAEL